ncbi:ABC transporter ATP-binding protein [Streptococcus didelphis]|uniref:ABC transporter ATP-binding protein n=1 Tax=Streptococcus didelphis TaxID=102886 RepID=UPI00036F829A|nr:ABC transporter ATP-binding protein [Streptococcus didelphis]
MTHLIQFTNFSFTYDAQTAPTLSNLNISIEKGQKVLIIGPSGSGKSTIGNCLNGIIPNHHQGQHQGSVMIDGRDVFDLSIYDKSKLISTVLQDPDSQFIGLTVAEDIAFALENDCFSQSDMKQKIHAWSQLLDLSNHLNHRPQDLSGGQKQRVSLAGVLVDESPILLFDEPLANLDPKSGLAAIDLIDQIHQTTDATTIIIEHRLEDVLHQSIDKIILINDGYILFDGSPDQLLFSNLLRENGIREPLYLTCLKDLAYPFSGNEHLSQLNSLDLSKLNFSYNHPSSKTPKKEKLLHIPSLTFAYDDEKPILKELNLEIHQGERLALVGQNGAGKSTLAKLLCRFLKTDAPVYYKGIDISKDSIKERADKIGYVLQNPNQMISQANVFDEVAKGLHLRKQSEADIKLKVEETLTICGLFPYRHWPISALSFGQKKRVTIASILILDPEIIILDEPTAGQDKRNYSDIMNFLDYLNHEGHTIIMITHDMQLMMEYSDRTIVLNKGKIIADARPEEILSDSSLLEKASLKKTSLFYLAEQLGCQPLDITHYYIKKERERHATETNWLSKS